MELRRWRVMGEGVEGNYGSGGSVGKGEVGKVN